MGISNLALKLILIMFPGLLATLLFLKLTIKISERSDFMFVIIVITESLFSYLSIQLILNIYRWINNLIYNTKLVFESLKIFSRISDSKIIPYDEIFYACVVSIIIGLITAKAVHENWLNTFGIKLGITNKFGEERIYSHFLNDPNNQVVSVRDISNSLTYWGKIEFFAENLQFKEIVLSQVTVFSYPESTELYNVPSVYLSFPNDKIIIEQAIKY